MKRLGLLRSGAACVGLICFTSACAAPRPVRVVSNPDPSGKIPAIKLSVQRSDMSVVAQLVKDLDSDDPAVRFYAIEGLERLTGETFGYRYFDDELERRPALEKWDAWLSGWEAASRER